MAVRARVTMTKDDFEGDYDRVTVYETVTVRVTVCGCEGESDYD